MKKFMKRATLATLAGVGMLACVGAGAATLNANAEDTVPVVAVAIEQKAAIRKEGPMGIRFTAKVENAEAINAFYGEGNVVYGMLITPADYLTEDKTLSFDGGLTEWTDGTLDVQNTYKNQVAIPNANGEMYGSFVGIQENNFSRPFAARAYIGVKEEGSETFTYTYSDVCSRAVYTVASYAVMDTAQGFSEEVMTYLNEVVDAVQVTYKDLSVDLGATEFDGTNNVVQPMATVTNGTRTLETGVAIAADNMTAIDLTTYEVDTLGTFTATASVGKLSKILPDLACTTVAASNDDVHVTTANKDATAVLTKVNARGRTNVLQWSTEADSCAGDASMLNFDGPFTKANIEGGNTYLTFDMWTYGNVALQWYGHKTADESSNSTISLYATSDNVKYFNEAGYTIVSSGLWKDSMALDRWITVQAKIPDGTYHANNRYAGLGFVNGFKSTSEVYLDNFRLSTEPFAELGNTTELTILANEADLGNMYAYNPDMVSLTYVEEAVAGRTGTFKWATTSESTFDGNDAALKIAETPAHKAWLKKDSYLSFDYYADVSTAVYWNNASYLLYNSPNTSYPKVRVFDEYGFEITTGTIWTGALLKKWITFEVQLDTDYSFANIALGLWRKDNFNNKANMYIDNVKVSTEAHVEPEIGEGGVILADKNDLRNMYPHNEVTTLTYVDEIIGGKSGVFKWATDSETNVSTPNATLRFAETPFTTAYLKTGKYLRFDIYVTKNVTVGWYGATNINFYGDYEEGFPDSIKLFDANGDEIVKDGTKGFWNGGFNEQWITVEILMTVDSSMFTSGYRGLGIYTGGFNASNPIYLDNVIVSTTSIAAV